jgi:hypothetical protein
MSKFVGVLPGSRPPISLKVTAAMVLHAAVTRSSADANTASAATNGKIYGHLEQAVIVAATDWADINLNLHNPKPAYVNETVTVRHWQTFEVEGADHILLAGTGQIAGGTATQTPLVYYINSGAPVLRIAQSGEYATHNLLAQLTPEEGSGVRLLVEELPTTRLIP